MAVETTEKSIKDGVEKLRSIYGERIPDDPTQIPFEELQNEADEEWDNVEKQIGELIKGIDQNVSEMEKEFDIVHGAN